MIQHYIQTYTIYADVLFFLNFFLDFFILWATGRFLRIKANYPRLLLAAFIGALYGVGIIFPDLSYLYSLILKLAFSLLLLRIAFPYRGFASFLQCIGAFYLISFAMAGAVLGGSSLLAGSGINIAGTEIVRWTSLVFALMMAIVLARKSFLWIKKNWNKENFKVNLEIFAQGHRCFIAALIDTGNDLADPISTNPVIVAEYQGLRPLLPQGLRELFESYGDSDPTQILQKGNIDGWEKRLRLIPFASIGKHHGMLLGFKPDKIIIYDEQKRETDQVIVALYRQKLGKDDSYQAIINPDVLEISQPLSIRNEKKELRA
ncbi:MAG: sigma-E processing peptidase SpoIIGA [Bacillota bacterium]|jgi:stage II sporulation protein GA (sporulation sigma-E factor processing peptidase)